MLCTLEDKGKGEDSYWCKYFTILQVNIMYIGPLG